MALSLKLKTASGDTELHLGQTCGAYVITIEHTKSSRSSVLHLSGIPSFQFRPEDVTPTSILGRSDTDGDDCLLHIEVTGELFAIIARNVHSPYVQVKTELGGDSWYGLGHFMRQSWPLNEFSLDFGPFYPFDIGSSGLCTHAEPTLYSTSGLFFKADDSSPCLHVGLNSALKVVDRPARDWRRGIACSDYGQLPLLAEGIPTDGMLRVESRKAFDSSHVGHSWMEPTRGIEYSNAPVLKLHVGQCGDVKSACDLGLKHNLSLYGPRRSVPPMDLLEKPIWTTWAKYGPEINAEKVLTYAQEICDRNLPRSVLEIDDMWSPKYGDFDFDETKFPDPKAMVDKLHEMGFQVTLWIIPFAQADSNAVNDEATSKHFMANEAGEVGLFQWWQPYDVGGLDVFNDEACEWFVGRLKRLQRLYGIDGYKFDAGEGNFIPPNSILATNCSTPAEYTRRWVTKVASRFPVSEIRSTVQGCQPIAPLVRVLDKYSVWDLQNGLASVVTSSLTSSILGYPFSLPDMIGGNAYFDAHPDAQLMIRWAQLSAALPTLQYSIAPWDHGTECDELCTLAMKWRTELFWGHIEKCIPSASSSYEPIVRPMWWIDTDNTDVRDCNDQFLIGNDLLIAPVVVKDATERNVHFPKGQWKRIELPGTKNQDEKIFSGGETALVHAALNEMPVYERC